MEDNKYHFSKALEYIRNELNHAESMNNNGDFAALKDVARVESSSDLSTGDSQVLLTLVNIEEEKTLKNSSPYIQRGDEIHKRNPTIFLNLYVLFSCPETLYSSALSSISRVVGFFQRKYVFTAETAEVDGFQELNAEKIILELCSMNFEQMNHLWGILGGKYIPSVLYKLRLIPIQESLGEKVSLVEEIKADSNQKN